MTHISRRTVECRRVLVALEYCNAQNGLVTEYRAIRRGSDGLAIVVDRFSNGSVYRETEIERSDLEAIIA